MNWDKVRKRATIEGDGEGLGEESTSRFTPRMKFRPSFVAVAVPTGPRWRGVPKV